MIDVLAGLLQTDSITSWLWKPYVKILYDYHYTLTSPRYYVAQSIRGFVPFCVSNRFSVSMPKVESFVDAVRRSEGSRLLMGAAGFSWGGKHAINLGHDGKSSHGKSLVEAIFTGYPSQLDIPGEIERIRKHVSVAVGDKDAVLGLSQVEQIKTILSRMDVGSEVRVFPGVGHGFCVRADPLNDHAVQQSLDAEEQAMKWFSLHLQGQK
jgi:dienelactone hydrolase